MTMWKMCKKKVAHMHYQTPHETGNNFPSVRSEGKCGSQRNIYCVQCTCSKHVIIKDCIETIAEK